MVLENCMVVGHDQGQIKESVDNPNRNGKYLKNHIISRTNF